MKKWLNNLLVTIALLLFIAVCFYILNEIIQRRHESTNLKRENNLLQNKIDSVLTIVDNLEKRKDTVWVDIHHWNTIYDTIIKQVPLLPPDSLVKAFDYLTGDTLDLSFLWENNVVTPLPRITNAVIQIYDQRRLEGLTLKLYEIIDLQKEQVTELYATIDLKDGQIELRDMVILERNNEYKQLHSMLIRDRVAGGAFILLLIALLFR